MSLQATKQGQCFDCPPCSAMEKASSHSGGGRGHGWAQVMQGQGLAWRWAQQKVQGVGV